jgi:predicted  nucleic acid-binding Zn-ribbon protein
VRRASVERRLADGTRRLAEAREELRVGEEQLAHLAAEADDARIRALVSETPIAGREHRDAERHAQAMSAHLVEVRVEIERLEREQDRLLDELGSS